MGGCGPGTLERWGGRGRGRPVEEVLRVKSMEDVHGKPRVPLASRGRGVGCSTTTSPHSLLLYR